MRNALSLCFLLALAFAVGVGCAKKKQTVDEGAAGTGTEAEAFAEEMDEGFEDETASAEGTEEGMPEEGMEEAPEGFEEEEAPEMPEEGMEEAPEGFEEEEAPEMPEEGMEEEAPEVPEEEIVEAPVAPGEIPEGVYADKERVAVLKERFHALAEAKYAEGNLADALDAYRSILMLDRSDEKALAGYQRIQVELGRRVPVAEEIVGTESQRVEARRQAMITELNERLARARASEEAGDYEDAIGYYQQILNLLNWYKYQADFPVTSEQARALLERAEREKELADARGAAEEIKRIAETEQQRQERQREEEVRRMGIFLRMASDAFDQGEYDLAQAHATKVLNLDPRNEQAKELIRIAKETKYTSDRNEIREQFMDQWRTIMEQIEYDALPHPEVLRYPDSWAEIAQRQPKRAGSNVSAAPDPRTEQILNTLSQRRVYDLRFEEGEITLTGAIEYLRSVTGLNFVLSQKVKEEKADTEISLNLDNVSVRLVLDLITEPNEMAWRVRNGVIMILDKEEALDKPILQFYDVKDLVAKIGDFPGDEINLVPSRYVPPEDWEEVEPTSPFEVDSLIEVIQQTIEPDSWGMIEGAGIEPKSNILVVRTTADIHRKIGEFLGNLRKHTGLLVSLEVRFLTAEDRFLRDVGVDIRGLGDQTGGVGLPGLGGGTDFDDSFAGSTANPSGAPPGIIPEPSSIGTAKTPGAFYSDGGDGEYKGRVENLFDFILNFDEPGTATASAAAGGVRGANSGGFTLQHVFLDDTQFEVILRAVEKSERIEQISAPRLTVYDTQRANVSVMKQNSYVQDFDVEIAQAAAIGDPIIQTIRDGVILDVRPIVSADRRFITMEMRPTVAELVRPIPTFQTSLATGPPVTIQVPELSISRVRTTVTMPDGGMLLLGGIKFFRDAIAESGVPVLSKIPVISFLFSRKAKTVQRRNLLILIKAEVMVPEEHAPDHGVRY